MIFNANALSLPIADASVQCVVTSPPYWGLRDYGVSGQLGLEKTPDCLGWATGHPCGVCYVCHMVAVFREVRRVMREDGTCFLNLGDSYAADQKGGAKFKPGDKSYTDKGTLGIPRFICNHGLKPKDLIGIPWRVALALQADGWWLRSDIIWAKPNPMPESVTDRATKSHEYIFLLTKAAHYYWDQEAVKEKSTYPNDERKTRARSGQKCLPTDKQNGMRIGKSITYPLRNIRTVWTIATQPIKEAHFATFPEALAERCIKAGSRMGDLVLDPFTGSGTTGRVCIKYNRRFIGTELNFAYIADIASKRMANIQRELAGAV